MAIGMGRGRASIARRRRATGGRRPRRRSTTGRRPPITARRPPISRRRATTRRRRLRRHPPTATTAAGSGTGRCPLDRGAARMCTVILLHRPGQAWPVLVAANRDEMLDRAWDPPGPWWPGQPEVTGGRDRLSGGTWMAANRAGVMAAVLNRPGSLGPAAGKRSRGELPLLALRETTARDAAARIAALPAEAWRPFNMVIADRHGGIFLRGEGRGRP